MDKDKCLFCQIVKGKAPCYKVYEDKHSLAFLDINPATRGHTLLIPKKHSENIFDIEDQDLQSIALGIKKLASQLKKSLKADGINIIQSNGQQAGQVIFHLHFHIIPRYKDDNFQLQLGKIYHKKDFKEILEEIHKGW
jgi:histidine triad (HIT) family protein